MVGVTVEKVLSVAVIGLGVPLSLSAARTVTRGFVAHALASGLLYALGATLEEAFGDDATSASNYAEVGGDMLLLTALGELAFFIRSKLPMPKYTKSMRVYDCAAMLLVSFLVIGQLVEVLDMILPFDIAESGTFLGLVLAGLAYSIRDVLVCFIAGLYETASPVLHEGDRVRVGDHHGTVERKHTTSVVLRGEGGARITLPCTMLVHDAVTVLEAEREDQCDGSAHGRADGRTRHDQTARVLMQHDNGAVLVREP
jgi:small-conductance mechanosensitive channel